MTRKVTLNAVHKYIMRFEKCECDFEKERLDDREDYL
jgi:hypothetical protein